MLDEKFEQSSQTSFNIVQHRPTLSNMFDCAVQTGQTCCVQQCLIMFDQHNNSEHRVKAMIRYKYEQTTTRLTTSVGR